jgi:acetyl esterase
MKTKKLLLLIFLASAPYLAQAQTCSTGQVDERATTFLKRNGTGSSALELKNASTASLRKQPEGAFLALPADSVKRMTITKDNIKVNVCRVGTTEGLTVIINFHPGGFVVPLQPWMEYEALALAKKHKAVVFDVDYRVAPESKFPTAANDAYSAYKWVVEHAKEYGGNPDKIFLCGTDAGATLATLVSQRAKKENALKNIKGVILICPMVDNPMISYYESFETNATGYGLTKDMVQNWFQLYLDKTLWFSTNAQVWPIYERELAGLPATLLITTEFDVLRDEGVAYGKKLEQAGNAVAIKCFPHMIHNFWGLSSTAEEKKRLDTLIAELISAGSK